MDRKGRHIQICKRQTGNLSNKMQKATVKRLKTYHTVKSNFKAYSRNISSHHLGYLVLQCYSTEAIVSTQKIETKVQVEILKVNPLSKMLVDGVTFAFCCLLLAFIALTLTLGLCVSSQTNICKPWARLWRYRFCFYSAAFSGIFHASTFVIAIDFSSFTFIISGQLIDLLNGQAKVLTIHRDFLQWFNSGSNHRALPMKQEAVRGPRKLFNFNLITFIHWVC